MVGGEGVYQSGSLAQGLFDAQNEIWGVLYGNGQDVHLQRVSSNFFVNKENEYILWKVYNTAVLTTLRIKQAALLRYTLLESSKINKLNFSSLANRLLPVNLSTSTAY